MMTDIPIAKKLPPMSIPITTSNGSMHPVWYDWFRQFSDSALETASVQGGEAIDVQVVGNTFVISAEDASSTNKGVATFNSSDFNVSSGDVGINDSGINHDGLANYVANRHIDHTSVQITAGAGLTGGGDISSTRTLNVGAGTGITVNDDDVAVNVNGLSSVTAASTDEVMIADASDGFNLKKVTAQSIANLAPAGSGDVAGPASSTDNNIAVFDGTTGKVIKDGGATIDSLASHYILLSSQTASSSATIDFTGLDSTYRAYKVILTNVLVATDAQNLRIRIGTGSPATYQSGGTAYYWVINNLQVTSAGAASNNPTGDYSDSEMDMLSSAGNITSNEAIDGEVTVYNPSNSSTTKSIQWTLTLENEADTLQHVTGSGRYISGSTAITAIRFLASSGNIASGTFSLYGIKA